MKDFELKSHLKKGALTIGSWITLGSADTTEIMAQSGFDWLTIDMEHSVITLDKAQELIRTIEANDTVPLVRVAENRIEVIKQVMDAGAYGVIVPFVNTQEDAVRAVEAVKYPPLGKRGVGLARAQGHGLSFNHYKNWVNKESICIVQIEHITAVENLEEILQVKDIDGFIVGPYDLSASLGVPGEFNHPQVKDACRRIMKIAKKFGKPAGFHLIPPDASELSKKVKEGYSLLGFSLDALFLGTFCRQQLTQAKKVLRKR